MKLLKRLTALALIFCMVIATPAFSSPDDQSNVSDVTEVFDRLVVLGIIEQAVPHKMEDIISRAEFIDYVLKMLNIKSVSPNGDMFSDVDLDYWASGQIAAGAQMGLITGFSDGKFYPESPILPLQALKIMVSVLGYDALAGIKGGYPNGYQLVANDIKVLEGIDLYSRSDIDFATMIQLMANTLDTDIYETVSFGNQITYNSVEGVTLLTQIYNIQKRRGIVTETSVTALMGESTVDANKVRIEGEIYDAGFSGISDYLGYHVDFYVKFDIDRINNTILYFSILDTNKVTVVDAEDIQRDNNSFSPYNFVYVDDRDRVTNIKIPSGVALIYNGKAKPNYEKKDLMPKKGTVTLVNSGTGDAVSCISVFDVNETVFLSFINNDPDKYVLFDKNNAGHYASLPTDGETDNFVIYKKGERISISEINENDILSVGYSYENDYALVMAADKSVVGTIDSIASNGKVSIDGLEYVIDEDYLKMTGDTSLGIQEIKLGLSGTFYFDCFDKICGVKLSTANQFTYAYLMDAVVESGVNPIVKLKIVTLNDGLREIALANFVMLEDTRTPALKVYEQLKRHNKIYRAGFQPGNDFMQLIKYDINENEEIRTLYQAKNKDAGGGLLYDGTIENKREYAHYSNTWSSKYYRNSNTQIFYIYNNEELCVVSNDYNIAENQKGDIFFFYDVDEKGMVSAVITYPTDLGGSNNNVSNSTRISVVTGRGKSVDREGSTVDCIRCYTNGEQDSILYNDAYFKTSATRQYIFKTAQPGDVLIYNISSNGDVTKLIRVFDVSKEWIGEFGITANNEGRTVTIDGESVYINTPQGFRLDTGVYYESIHQERKIVAAVVNKVFSDFFQFVVEPGDNRIQPASADMQVYRVVLNDSDVKVIPGLKYKDIKPGNVVFFRCERNNVKDLVIYEDNRTYP